MHNFYFIALRNLFANPAGNVLRCRIEWKYFIQVLICLLYTSYFIRVKESLCKSLDKEAIRLILEGPDWTYGNKIAEVTVKFLSLIHISEVEFDIGTPSITYKG